MWRFCTYHGCSENARHYLWLTIYMYVYLTMTAAEVHSHVLWKRNLKIGMEWRQAYMEHGGGVAVSLYNGTPLKGHP